MSNDVSWAQQHLADGFVAGHSWGQWQTKDEFIKDLQNKPSKWKSGDISDVHVATFGFNTAIAHYKFTYDAEINGTHRARSVICSDTWVNDSGAWKSGSTHGGLFLGSEAGDVLIDAQSFAITQDQRNTARARIRVQTTRYLRVGIDGQYGSGLPAEIGDADIDFLRAQYGPAILDQVDFVRGRVKPNFAVGVNAGTKLYQKDQRSVVFQIRGANLTNHLNVINFASLFSGTAVAPPRTVSISLNLTF